MRRINIIIVMAIAALGFTLAACSQPVTTSPAPVSLALSAFTTNPWIDAVSGFEDPSSYGAMPCDMASRLAMDCQSWTKHAAKVGSSDMQATIPNDLSTAVQGYYPNGSLSDANWHKLSNMPDASLQTVIKAVKNTCANVLKSAYADTLVRSAWPVAFGKTAPLPVSAAVQPTNKLP